MEENVLLISSIENAVVLTINRPNALNALNRQVFDALDDFFTNGYRLHEPFSAVIITGQGNKAFAAGADIKEFDTLDGRGMTVLSRRGQGIFQKIEDFHKPVIAAVNGFSLGGGCELAMACHMRIASEAARFGQPEVNLGIIPGYGGTQRLPQLVGKAKAFELILTGDMIQAEEAYRLGLVNHIVEHEELLPIAEKIVAKIAKKGPIAIKNVIKAINACYDKQDNGYIVESDQFGETADSEDFREGAAAFVEKRKANFQGR